jgi:hypothetical protein
MQNGRTINEGMCIVDRYNIDYVFGKQELLERRTKCKVQIYKVQSAKKLKILERKVKIVKSNAFEARGSVQYFVLFR